MTIRRFVLTLAFVGTLGAQTFIQMSDPQFGMFTKNASFEHETLNFEFAIAHANRLKPAFVVITGDLINDAKNVAQAAEYKRITSKLDPKIKLFSVAGNHDVENEPTKETLARYRERVGPDYYSLGQQLAGSLAVEAAAGRDALEAGCGSRQVVRLQQSQGQAPFGGLPVLRLPQGREALKACERRPRLVRPRLLRRGAAGEDPP